jgi:hypothetical protein
VINLRIYNALDALVAQTDITFDQVYRHSYWWWNYTFAAEVRGAHELEIRVNDTLVQTYSFAVEAILSGFWQARHGVPAVDYQALFNTLVANGYRPIWVDGYDVNQQTFFNVIFERNPVASWASAHGLNASEYQAYFDAQVNAGRRLVHIDSYRENGAIVYAPIFVEQPGSAWVAYHGVSLAQHQSLFDTYLAQGFRAAVISLEQNGGGDLEVTALYDQDNVGGWVALANLNSADYQAQFDAQSNAGLRLSYLNGYTINGIAHFSAIWNSMQSTSWVARHDLTGEQYQNEFDTWTAQGLTLRFVTGYENNTVANFGAYWTD